MKNPFQRICVLAVMLSVVHIVQAAPLGERKQIEIIQAGDAKLPHVERQIRKALDPFAKKHGLVVQTGVNVRNDEGVYYARKEDAVECDGTSACTVMAVYYNTHPECARLYHPGFRKNQGGSGRDSYNLYHKKICYQLSVTGKSTAKAVAQALKKGI